MIICMLDAGQFIEKPEFLEPLKQYGEIRIFSGMPKSVDEVVARAMRRLLPLPLRSSLMR